MSISPRGARETGSPDGVSDGLISAREPNHHARHAPDMVQSAYTTHKATRDAKKLHGAPEKICNTIATS